MWDWDRSMVEAEVPGTKVRLGSHRQLFLHLWKVSGLQEVLEFYQSANDELRSLFRAQAWSGLTIHGWRTPKLGRLSLSFSPEEDLQGPHFCHFQNRKHRLKSLVFINEGVLSLGWELDWYFCANGSGLYKLLVSKEGTNDQHLESNQNREGHSGCGGRWAVIW